MAYIIHRRCFFISKIIKVSIFIVSFLCLVITSFCIFDSVEVNAENIEKEDNNSTIYVDVKGAVNEPGVYEMKNGSRVIDAIIKAGDLREDADTSILNLSKELKDEMYIIVYTKDEINTFKEKILPSKKIIKEIEEKIICPDTDNDACITDNDKVSSGLVNINTASLEELQSIPGVGETKAKKIIEYRETKKFDSLEDIKNVSGIGDNTYEKIKDYITY